MLAVPGARPRAVPVTARPVPVPETGASTGTRPATTPGRDRPLGPARSGPRTRPLTDFRGIQPAGRRPEQAAPGTVSPTGVGVSGHVTDAAVSGRCPGRLAHVDVAAADL